MKELNLHGVKHADVERLVENAVLFASDDVHIITGNSIKMQELVRKTLSKYEIKHMTLAKNLGEVIALCAPENQ